MQFAARILILIGIFAAFPAQADKINIPVPTLGGAQIWTDEVLQGGWRVQRNHVTGHCRLLDDKDFRRQWGQKNSCTERLAELRQQDTVPDNPEHLVILVHGIGGHRISFRTMEAAFMESGITATRWNYGSTRAGIADHAVALNAMMNRLEGVERVTFVAHSMGGLILRVALADDTAAWRQDSDVTGIMMLGTPNQGAALADRLADGWLAKGLAEEAAQNLTPDYVTQIPKLTVPYCLIAGRLETPAGETRRFRARMTGWSGLTRFCWRPRTPQ